MSAWNASAVGKKENLTYRHMRKYIIMNEIKILLKSFRYYEYNLNVLVHTVEM